VPTPRNRRMKAPDSRRHASEHGAQSSSAGPAGATIPATA
jgi:hypothetical protein